jgi:hypothetical protein
MELNKNYYLDNENHQYLTRRSKQFNSEFKSEEIVINLPLASLKPICILQEVKLSKRGNVLTTGTRFKVI